MVGFNLSGLIKFLTGILLVQSATGLLVAVALRVDNHEIWILCLLLALTLCLITAFWFTSLIAHARKDATSQVREGFSREREKIRVRAEREKSKLMERSHQQIIKERNRSQTKGKTLSTTLFAGLLALGGTLIFTQFFTFGLLLMTTAGGALAGYLLRSRQTLLGRRQRPSLESGQTEKQIGERVSGDW